MSYRGPPPARIYRQFLDVRLAHAHAAARAPRERPARPADIAWSSGTHASRAREQFAKEALATQALSPGDALVELCCGTGPDAGKWERAGISKGLFLEPSTGAGGTEQAKAALGEAKGRWEAKVGALALVHDDLTCPRAPLLARPLTAGTRTRAYTRSCRARSTRQTSRCGTAQQTTYRQSGWARPMQ